MTASVRGLDAAASGIEGVRNLLGAASLPWLQADARADSASVGGQPLQGQPAFLSTVIGVDRSTGKQLGGDLMFGRTATGSALYWLKGRDTNYVLRSIDGNPVTNAQEARARASALISGGGATRLRPVEKAGHICKPEDAPRFAQPLSLTFSKEEVFSGRSNDAAKQKAVFNQQFGAYLIGRGMPRQIKGGQLTVSYPNDASGGRLWAAAEFEFMNGHRQNLPTSASPAFKRGVDRARGVLAQAAFGEKLVTGMALASDVLNVLSSVPNRKLVPAAVSTYRPSVNQTTVLVGKSAAQSGMPSNPLVAPKIGKPKSGTTVGAAPPARNPTVLKLTSAESALAAIFHPAAEGTFVVGKQDGVVASGRWDPTPAQPAESRGRYTRSQVDGLAREVGKVPEAARTSVTGTVKKMLQDNTAVAVIRFYLKSHVRGWEPVYHHAALFKIHDAIKNKNTEFSPLSIGDIARLNADTRKIVEIDAALKSSVHGNSMSTGYASFVNSIKTSQHDLAPGLEIMQVADKILSGRYPDAARAMKLFNALVEAPNAETARTLTRALKVLPPAAYESFAQYSIHRAKKSPDRDQVNDFLGTSRIRDLVRTATARDPSKASLLENYTGYFEQKTSLRFTPGEFATMSSRMHVFRADQATQAGDSAVAYLHRRGGGVTIALDGDHIAVGSTSKHDLRRYGQADCTVQIADQGSMMVDRYTITSLDTNVRPVHLKLPGQTNWISAAELGARQSPWREGMNPITPEAARSGGHHFTASVPEGTQVKVRNYNEGKPDIVFTLPD